LWQLGAESRGVLIVSFPAVADRWNVADARVILAAGLRKRKEIMAEPQKFFAILQNSLNSA
jgi:hypothetical protein